MQVRAGDEQAVKRKGAGLDAYSAAIAAERLRLVSLQARRVPIGVVALLAYLLYILWPYHPHDKLLAWAAGPLAMTLVRTATAWRMLSREPSLAEVPRWLQINVVTALMVGALGGLGALLFFAGSPPEVQALFTMVICCWSAGAIGTNAANPPQYYAVAIPLLVPTAYSWAVADAPGAGVLAVLIALFGVYQILFVLDNGRMITDAIRIRYERAEMIEELEARRRESEEARAVAEAASRAKSNFLAAASHDLRQPVTALSLFTGALMLYATDERVRTVANKIDGAVRSVDVLLNALLDLSKLDAGVVKAEIQPFVLSEMLDRLRQEMEPRARARNLTLAITGPALHVRSDPVLMERMVRNLVENAIRYTPAGGVTLQSWREGKDALVQVRDTGVGIPEELHDRVFEEYFQVSNPNRDRSKGLGLGLAIVRRLADVLGCDIALDSKPGVGTSITLRLRDAVEEQRAPDPGARAADSLGALQGASVLVVDDEEEIRDALETLLGGWGCHALVTASAEEALATYGAAARPPAVLLVDYRLAGGKTGLEAVQTLRTRFASVPVLLMTGDTAPDVLREAEVSGYPVLHKPLQPSTLRAALSSLIELQASIDGDALQEGGRI